MFQVKISFASVVKLLFQISTEPSKERIPKDHYFRDTQGHFELKGKDKFKSHINNILSPVAQVEILLKMKKAFKNPSDHETNV